MTVNGGLTQAHKFIQAEMVARFAAARDAGLGRSRTCPSSKEAIGEYSIGWL